jgi:hypothetical protein
MGRERQIFADKVVPVVPIPIAIFLLKYEIRVL